MSNILRKFISLILDLIETIVTAFAIFVIVYLFLFRPHQVKGNSMLTSVLESFHDGDYLLTNLVTYRFNNPKRDDVIIFKAPNNEDYDYIKRVVGLPGERLKILNGNVYINDKILDESKYLSNIQTQAGRYLQEGEEITIPEEKYFVLGDNRDHSSDSRDWGPVPRKNIIGKAWFRYWPVNELGLIKYP